MRVLAGRDPVRYTFALLPMPSHDALSHERVQPLEHDGNSVAMMNPRSMAEDIRYGGSCRVPIECMRVYAQAQVCDLLPKHTRCPAPNFGGTRLLRGHDDLGRGGVSSHASPTYWQDKKIC